MMNVPYSGGRSGTNAPPYFLWDNSAYVLGVTAKENFDASKRFEAFRNFHIEVLENAKSRSLCAVLSFLQSWTPDKFKEYKFPVDIMDRNIVFRHLDEKSFAHEGVDAQSIWGSIYQPDVIGESVCLISGEVQPIARLHPPIKTFENPARIVSFDQTKDAFSSYGHVQAENAPTGIKAAFAYTAVLNRFLEKGSGHRIQIGDASTVFWADASEAEAVVFAEGSFLELMGAGEVDETAEARHVEAILDKIRQGIPLADLALDLPDGVRFFVLGLAPNAARLSVRFFVENDFKELATKLLEHHHDIALEPSIPAHQMAVWMLVDEAAVHLPREMGGKVVWRKSRSSEPPPNLGGEMMRAILTGTRYPLSMLDAVCRRVRAERGRITPRRAAICRAVINRNDRLNGTKETVPMALDREEPNSAYRLGRLFALLERAQQLALPKLNATIRDRFFAGACTAPAKVFPMLVKTSMHHLAAARKDPTKKNIAGWIETEMGKVWSGLEMDTPKSLRLQDQGRFQVGYFHQKFAKTDKSGAENLAVADEADAPEDTTPQEAHQ